MGNKEYLKKYREANKDRLLAYQSQYRRDNKEAVNAGNRRRYHAKKLKQKGDTE